MLHPVSGKGYDSRHPGGGPDTLDPGRNNRSVLP